MSRNFAKIAICWSTDFFVLVVGGLVVGGLCTCSRRTCRLLACGHPQYHRDLGVEGAGTSRACSCWWHWGDCEHVEQEVSAKNSAICGCQFVLKGTVVKDRQEAVDGDVLAGAIFVVELCLKGARAEKDKHIHTILLVPKSGF